MLDLTAIRRSLGVLGLDDWADVLGPLLDERMSPRAHGDYAAWADAVAGLDDAATVDRRRELLLRLAPWRKGPFDVSGVHIDAEWRSDLKWERVRGNIASLRGRNVLDVGCGNGYYALRMLEEGATAVIGIDPTILYILQFLAVTRGRRNLPVHVLPLRLAELPSESRAFDTVFSMGVLYHQRSPIDHLRELRDALKSGGQLVLETIFLPGDAACARTPADRYARMRNVWLLPTMPELETWLVRTGYRDVTVVDVSVTTSAEQRRTEWMTFESLADALDPGDPTQTVEGWPAPRRVVLTATAP